MYHLLLIVHTGPPIIMTHPSYQVITMSSMSVTLNCQGVGGGSIAYQWESRRGSGRQWMNISNSNTETLFVRTLERSRLYRCVVSNEAGSTRSNVAAVDILSELCANVNIMIMILTTGFSNQPMNHTVTALDDAMLQCTSPLDNVRYSWHRVNGQIPSRSIGQMSFRLTIPRAIPPDEGLYYCVISKNSVSIESDRATLEVNGKLVFVLAIVSCTKIQ